MPYNAQGQWTGGAGGGLLTPENAVMTGLGGAAGLIGSQAAVNYPSYVSSQNKAPGQSSYINYTPNQPMAQITAPNYQLNSQAPTWQGYNPSAPTINQQYQGLMGGDYNALQSALTTPGQIGAEEAYRTGSRNLDNAMGNRGMYGSSVMATQANEGINREYMNALAKNAANAAATRYGLQATDLQNQNTFGMNQALANQSAQQANQSLLANQNLAKNQFGTDIYGKQLAQEQDMNTFGLDSAKLMASQNQNVYQAGVLDAARQQDYNTAALEDQRSQEEKMRQWQNSQDLEKFQYNLAAGQYANQQNTQGINQYLSLAGLGAPIATNNANNTANSQNNWLQAGLTTAGLLGDWYFS